MAPMATKLAVHLAGLQAQGPVAGNPIAQYEIGDYKNFVYLILDWTTRKAAWVDPQKNLTEPLAFLGQERFELETILLTHTHHDHIAGVPALLSRFGKIDVRVHERDARRFGEKSLEHNRVASVHDGEKLKIGSLEIQVLHTPGHSAGECCYLLTEGPGYLLTGDTLFIRDCGRTDLESGSDEEMFASLQRIKALPPQTVILPGHHYARECASTLEQELRDSPPLRCRSVEELRSLP